MKTTYYQILGIPETATFEDIKSAYRRVAKEHHPDKGSKTDEKYREAKEAYEVLKDPEKRLFYDKKIKPTKVTPARTRKGSDVTVFLKVDLKDLIGEISKTILTTRSNLCLDCAGTGSTKKALQQCPKCNGTGIDIVSAVVGPKRFCTSCKGYGNIAAITDCKKCGGTGLLKEKIQKTFSLNRENQNQIVIKEAGNYPFGGGLPGDLIVSLICENKSLFEISGSNIKGILPISPAQAVLGDVISINVFNALLKVAVPPGTESGAILEKTDIPFGPGKGKLILKVQIIIPKNPNNEEKGLYKHLLKLQKGLL